MGPKRKDAQHLELDDADILAVVDPSDDNTIPRARRPEFLRAKSTLSFPPARAAESRDSSRHELAAPAPPSRRSTLPPPRLPAHSAMPKATLTGSPFARRADSQQAFPVQSLPQAALDGATSQPFDRPPTRGSIAPVSIASAASAGASAFGARPSASPPAAVEARLPDPPRRSRLRSILWGAAFMTVGAGAAAGVFVGLAHFRAPQAPAAAAAPEQPATAAPTATAHAEPAVTVGVQKRPVVVTFDDALVVDEDKANAAAASSASSVAPGATGAAPIASAAPRRVRRSAAPAQTPSDVLGAALSGSQDPAPGPATAAAPPPPAPPPAAPKPAGQEREAEGPKRPKTPMEALADAQLKAALK